MKLSKKAVSEKLTEVKRILLKKVADKKTIDVFLVSNSEMDVIKKDLVARPDFKGREASKIKKEKYVNVLSFPAGDFPQPGSKVKSLGEVYINAEMCDWDLDRMAYLLIHGLLHLVGYDHIEKNARIEMEKKERELWHHAFS